MLDDRRVVEPGTTDDRTRPGEPALGDPAPDRARIDVEHRSDRTMGQKANRFLLPLAWHGRLHPSSLVPARLPRVFRPLSGIAVYVVVPPQPDRMPFAGPRVRRRDPPLLDPALDGIDVALEMVGQLHLGDEVGLEVRGLSEPPGRPAFALRRFLFGLGSVIHLDRSPNLTPFIDPLPLARLAPIDRQLAEVHDGTEDRHEP